MNSLIKRIGILSLLFFSYFTGFSQCANQSNIYSFNYNGKSYEVVKENKTWIDAAACAVERGGMLAEIDGISEQNAIYAELNANAGIVMSSTTAPDGGGGAYVWIGGNDMAIEGNWVWDGNNDNTSAQFWMGTASGSPVGGLFNNWGNEPDNFNGQDGLGLSLNGWPLGVAGEWNDVDTTNTLYFVIEYPTILGVEEKENFNNNIRIYPNPFTDFITIENTNLDLESATIFSSLGQELITLSNLNLPTIKMDLSELNAGIYFINIHFKNGENFLQKIIK